MGGPTNRKGHQMALSPELKTLAVRARISALNNLQSDISEVVGEVEDWAEALTLVPTASPALINAASSIAGRAKALSDFIAEVDREAVEESLDFFNEELREIETTTKTLRPLVFEVLQSGVGVIEA